MLISNTIAASDISETSNTSDAFEDSEKYYYQVSSQAQSSSLIYTHDLNKLNTQNLIDSFYADVKKDDLNNLEKMLQKTQIWQNLQIILD